jgi:exodeoxyribonuclease V gamma subunit
VVCLLGTDDGTFPRRRRPDGDNITETDPWVGDRDPRSEDRQLLLDAIMAAEDRLVVVFAGLDPRTNAEIPPAVPIGELLEVLDLTARTSDGRPVREQVVVQHPLQPFDPRNFEPGRLGAPRGFSFDPGALRAVRAATRTRTPPVDRFTLDPLPRLPETGLVELADLLRFFAHPVRALLRDRAGLSVRGTDEQPDEQIPAQLRGLDRWAVGDRMLRLHLQGHDLSRLRDAEWRRGAIPPRMLGARALGQLVDEVAEVAAAAVDYRTGEPERYPVDITLPGAGERLTGMVPSVFGDDLVRVGFSRVSARHRLQSWLELLALTAADPARPWRAVTIGSRGRSVLGPVGGPRAAEVLADLVELRWTGLCEPLPFSPRTSAEYATLRRDQQLTSALIRDVDKVWAQDRDPVYERFFGTGVTMSALLAQPSRTEEVWGDMGEPSRFGTLARRVFAPMLWYEELT